MTDGVEENKGQAWNSSRKKWKISEINFSAKDRNQKCAVLERHKKTRDEDNCTKHTKGVGK